MSVRIYVEGGGKGIAMNDCRRAFTSFFGKVVETKSFTVIPSGDWASTLRNFRWALRDHPGDNVILLVDSDERVSLGVWQHLKKRQGNKWTRPSGSSDCQGHLMVQVMESWFLADKKVLSEYYGKEFRSGALPRQTNIELVPKRQVLDALKHASQTTQKGQSHKRRHGFDLLGLINPELVRSASHHAERLLAVLERETVGKVTINPETVVSLQ